MRGDRPPWGSAPAADALATYATANAMGVSEKALRKLCDVKIRSRFLFDLAVSLTLTKS